MALRDISNVTSTLINLIDRVFRVPGSWPSINIPAVLAYPPVRTTSNGIGIFLYHITEDSHYKNLPAPGGNTPPVAYTSMGLTLHYQLSCYQSDANASGGQDVLMEQQMMAVAMKGLHDYPNINDTTVVKGALDVVDNPITSPVFPLDIRGRSNRFRIVYKPVSPQEAIGYWTPGEANLNLAAYYEVSVVLLEPEVAQIRKGRVFEYNIFTTISGHPKLIGSSNLVSFISPIDNQSRDLIFQPAQVPPAPSGALPPDPTPYQLVLNGVNLSDVTLELIHSKWDEPGIVRAPEGWALEQSANEIRVAVRESVWFNGAATTRPLLPDIYAVRVSHTEAGRITEYSNQCPFTVVPRIDSTLNVPLAAGVNIPLAGYLFTFLDSGIEQLKLNLYIGPDRLEQKLAGPLDGDGQFRVIDANNMEFRLPVGVTSGDRLPLRLFVNGVESPPRWIEVS